MTYEQYCEEFGEVSEYRFSVLELYAQTILKRYTTTLDGVQKLKLYPPVDEETIAQIELARLELMRLKAQVDEYNSAASVESTTSNSGSIASISSGSESISFHNAGDTSYIAQAASTIEGLKTTEQGIVEQYLSGLKDANGVNLLYRGIYPKWRIK